MSRTGLARRLAQPGRVQRLGGLALLAGLYGALLGLLVRWVSPGPTPAIRLRSPEAHRSLPAGAPVRLQGHARHVAELACNGRAVPLGPGGWFRAAVPGPSRAGLYLLRCTARNQRGRAFPFVYGRLAGRLLPLGTPVRDAVVLRLPLGAALAKSGLLGPLRRLAEGADFARSLVRALDNRVRWKGVSLGPFQVQAITLLGLEARGPNQVTFRLGLRQARVGLEVAPEWIVRLVPKVLRPIAGLLESQRFVPLGRLLPISLTLTLRPGRPPELALGPLSTEQLRRALRFKALAELAVEALGLLSRSWRDRLAQILVRADAPLRALARAFRRLQARLTRLAGLLPPLPAAVSPSRPSVCLALSISHLDTDAALDALWIHLDAQVIGTVARGRSCGEVRPEARAPVGPAARRLALGPPALAGTGAPSRRRSGVPVAPSGRRGGVPVAPSGRRGGVPVAAGQGRGKPASLGLLVSLDLVNAYLAALWSSGALGRVPIRLPALARTTGFDLRGLSYGLAPVITTTPQGQLRLEVGELGVDLATVGEPRRLMVVQLRARLDARVTRPGRLRLAVVRSPGPQVWIRCDQEAGRSGCAATSRRFQQLVDLGLELAQRPELAVPTLALEAALPALGFAGHAVQVTEVRPVARGIWVGMQVGRPAKGVGGTAKGVRRVPKGVGTTAK